MCCIYVLTHSVLNVLSSIWCFTTWLCGVSSHHVISSTLWWFSLHREALRESQVATLPSLLHPGISHVQSPSHQVSSQQPHVLLAHYDH